MTTPHPLVEFATSVGVIPDGHAIRDRLDRRVIAELRSLVTGSATIADVRDLVTAHQAADEILSRRIKEAFPATGGIA